MQGFDKEKAKAFILKNLDVREFRALAPEAETLTTQAIDADLAYMRHAGILTEDGVMGEAYYDDDDAYEYILETIARVRKTPEREMDSLCDFVEQYMELIERYMLDNDLLSWE